MMTFRRVSLRPLAAALALGTLAACGEAPNPDTVALEPLGDFYLGHNIVTVNEPAVAPVSRRASDEEWKTAMETAIQRRFGRYDGTRYYHIGISVDGYALAPPGIPLVVAPKSVLLISATVWDDAAGGKINDEPERFTVFEGLNAETMVGSGLTKSKEEQIETLATNAAEAVHRWMVQNSAWFENGDPAPAAAPGTDAAPAAGTGEPPDEPVETAALPPAGAPAN